MGLRQWIHERFPISAILYWGLHEPIPGGSGFAYVLGSSTLFLFVIQVVTGIWQMFYYVPTVDHAYASVSYLRLQVPFGWLIHGLHYWGATAFLVVMGLHAARVFIWAAYKKPRELTWFLGVSLILMAAGLMFTGAVLPWDLMGYWAGQVGMSISGTVPWMGKFIKSMMQGGPAMGQLTLMRMFVLHVAFLPALALGFIFAHVVSFRQFGSAGPWSEKKGKSRTGWFWPEQAFRDVVVAGLILLVLVGLTVYAPAPISGPADPLDQTYTPKPEWNFLFLYQSLKAFKGSWEVAGTVGIPTLLVLLLIVPPLLDRRPERSPRKRPLAMLLGAIFVGGILTLTIFGYLSGREAAATAGVGGEAPGPAGAASTATSVPIASPASVDRGRNLFGERGCSACHSITGQPGLGPELSNEKKRGRTQEWLTVQIRDPKAHNPDSIMPPFTALNAEQVNDLVGYMISLPSAASATIASSQPAGAGEMPTAATSQKPSMPGLAAEMIGNGEHGDTLFSRYCAYCHGYPSGRMVAIAAPAPSLRPIRRDLFNSDPAIFAQNVDRIVQHGLKTEGSVAVMPDFGDSNVLSQAQIANIEAYILSMNGVDRAEILNPGVRPQKFFWIMVVTFAAVAVLLGTLLALTKSSKD